VSFEWADYLELAHSLQAQSSTGNYKEAMLRTAISRAYYCAFCHARNYSRDWLAFIPRNDPDDHGRLRAHLKAKRRKGDSDRLERLRQWRNECDYHDEVKIDLSAVALAAISEAERLLHSLSPPKPN